MINPPSSLLQATETQLRARGIVVGARVKIIQKIPPSYVSATLSQFGTITEVRPQNGGALIRFDGEIVSWGLGYEEFEVIPTTSNNLGRVLDVLGMLSYGTYQNNYEVDKEHD